MTNHNKTEQRHTKQSETFPCSAVIVLITFTPQFGAKVRGIGSKAIAAASYGHCFTIKTGVAIKLQKNACKVKPQLILKLKYVKEHAN